MLPRTVQRQRRSDPACVVGRIAEVRLGIGREPRLATGREDVAGMEIRAEQCRGPEHCQVQDVAS